MQHDTNDSKACFPGLLPVNGSAVANGPLLTLWTQPAVDAGLKASPEDFAGLRKARVVRPHQVFFPMAGKDDGWRKLKKNIRAELDESLLDQFHCTVSLPFSAGKKGKAAVKIVDDRGIESLRMLPLKPKPAI